MAHAGMFTRLPMGRISVDTAPETQRQTIEYKGCELATLSIPVGMCGRLCVSQRRRSGRRVDGAELLQLPPDSSELIAWNVSRSWNTLGRLVPAENGGCKMLAKCWSTQAGAQRKKMVARWGRTKA